MTDELRRALRFASAERRLLLRRELLEALISPIAAGAPLPEACGVAAAEHPSQPVRFALAHLAGELAAGRRLSDALAELEPLVDEPFVAAARIGERSGRMADALSACERVLDVRLTLARGLADAVMQPLLSIACAVAVVMLLLLVGAVRAVVLMRDPAQDGLMAFMARHPFLGAAGVLAIAIAVVLAWRALSGMGGDRILGRLPFVSHLRGELSLGMFCRQVALLVEAGTPLDEALDSSLPILPAGASRAALASAASRLRAGEPAGSAASELADPLIGAVLAAPSAEELAARLARVARWHEAEAARLSEFAHAVTASTSTALAGIACGAVVILAWSGYFELATHFVD